MNNDIEFVRLIGTERRVGPTLESVSRHWQGEIERFLNVRPPDDEAVLCFVHHIPLALRDKGRVHLLIVTSGSMGYCSFEEMTTIPYIRRKEAFECYQSLGIPKENIVWTGFGDCQLSGYRGHSHPSVCSALPIINNQ